MMCRKFEVNTLSNNGVITFCDFLSHNSTGYSTFPMFFFCVMTLLTRMQGVFRNQVVREQQDIKLREEIETIQKDKEEAITTLKARIEEIEKLITDREADLIKLECQLKQSIAEKYPRGSATKLAGEFQRLEKNKSGNSQSKAANGEVNSYDTCKVENLQNKHFKNSLNIFHTCIIRE